MKTKIVGSIIGVLALDEKNQILEKVLYEKNAETAAEKILKLEDGDLTSDVEALIKKLEKDGCDELVFENPALAKSVRERFNIKVETAKPSVAEMLSKSMLEFAVKSGFVRTDQEFRDWVHEVSVALTKKRVRKAVEKRDLMAIQAILAIDDLDKTINLFMSRIREWYGLHFPELDRLLEKHETFARLVLNLGSRENFTAENLEKEDLPEEKAKQIAAASSASMGAELREDDIDKIQQMCKTTLELYELRQKLETHVNACMEEVAPNVSALLGPLLGARLIAIAGGLNNLSKMPASTIQVLGAEKALFRALKTGTRPPKHGILFQHTLIHEATRWQRGKVARALAGKIAIAARVDAYSGKYMGDELKADLERRVKDIQEKYAEPPPMTQRQIPQQKPQGRLRRGRRR
jgi:nucleolar protein 56